MGLINLMGLVKGKSSQCANYVKRVQFASVAPDLICNFDFPQNSDLKKISSKKLLNELCNQQETQ